MPSHTSAVEEKSTAGKPIDFSNVKRLVWKKGPRSIGAESEADKEDGKWTTTTLDSTPSLPPWTTFTGVLEARRDSAVGKRIAATDPTATDGRREHLDHVAMKEYKMNNPEVDEEKLPTLYESPSAWIRGLWTAPEDWTELA